MILDSYQQNLEYSATGIQWYCCVQIRAIDWDHTYRILMKNGRKEHWIINSFNRKIKCWMWALRPVEKCWWINCKYTNIRLICRRTIWLQITFLSSCMKQSIKKIRIDRKWSKFWMKKLIMINTVMLLNHRLVVMKGQ